METEKKQERNLELRSEKVRSIIGQIPSSLVRYGITIIGLVLFVIAGVAYFMPYKKVYTGTAFTKSIGTHISTDSIETTIFLRFDGQRLMNGRNQTIHLTNGVVSTEGLLLNVSSIRDTLERQEAQVRFVGTEFQQIENQAVDFKLIQTSGNLLSLVLGQLLPTP